MLLCIKITFSLNLEIYHIHKINAIKLVKIYEKSFPFSKNVSKKKVLRTLDPLRKVWYIVG